MDGIEKKRNISLTGFMLSGKSTAGREAASRTGLTLIDFDAIIEERSSMTVTEIFSTMGEEYFRELESEILVEVSRKENQLLVPGGGIVLRRENRKLLKESSFIIWLRIGIEELEKRLRLTSDSTVRPLLQAGGGGENIAALLDKRDALYGDCDDIIDVDISAVEDVTVRVVESICNSGVL